MTCDLFLSGSLHWDTQTETSLAMHTTSTVTKPGLALIGEKRLAIALLRQAIQDLRSQGPSVSSEARYWIRSGNSGAMNFDFCCRVLSYDPCHVREQLLRRGAGECFPFTDCCIEGGSG